MIRVKLKTNTIKVVSPLGQGQLRRESFCVPRIVVKLRALELARQETDWAWIGLTRLPLQQNRPHSILARIHMNGRAQGRVKMT